MGLGPADIAQRSAVIGSLCLAVYAAVMTGQGWQERLGRRKQAYQDQMLSNQLKDGSPAAGTGLSGLNLTTQDQSNPNTPS